MYTLAEIKEGQKVRILSFIDPEIGAKLLEMGCLPGETVTLSKSAPLGCPIAIEVSGYELSLRKHEAASVLVEHLN
jgi:ferrous iron transport protein A